MNMQQVSLPHTGQIRRWTLQTGYVRAVLVLLSLLAVLPAAPIFQRTPGAASGTVLSLGAELLRGRVLYRDLWYSEPPLTAAINALGLALGGSGRWGVWALEFAAILAAALLLYELLQREFGVLPALFGTTGLLANLVFLYQRGNAAEDYALPLQVGAYLLLWGISGSARSFWRSFVIGLLSGLLVSLRLELVSVHLTVVVMLICTAIFTRQPRILMQLPVIGLGFLLVCAVLTASFAVLGGLPSLLDQVFRYHFFYSGITNPARISALGQALKTFYWTSGFFALGGLVYLVAIVFLFSTSERFREVLSARWMGAIPLAGGLLLLFNSLWDDRARGFYDFSALSSYRLGLAAAGWIALIIAVPFLAGWVERWSRGLFRRYTWPEASPLLLFPLALALVDFPIQLVFASLAGEVSGPHYLPVLPSLAVLIGFLVWSLQSGQRAPGSNQNVSVWLILLALPVLVTGWYVTADSVRISADDQALRIAEEIRATTRPEQPILQWGENPQLYFLADRPAASRFFQQRSLFRPGYASSERVQTFLEDLYAHSPVVFVDTRPADMPLLMQDCENLQYDDFVEQAVRAQRDERSPLLRGEPLPYYPLKMNAVYRWLCYNYEQISSDDSDPDAWRVYRLVPGKP